MPPPPARDGELLLGSTDLTAPLLLGCKSRSPGPAAVGPSLEHRRRDWMAGAAGASPGAVLGGTWKSQGGASRHGPAPALLPNSSALEQLGLLSVCLGEAPAATWRSGQRLCGASKWVGRRETQAAGALRPRGSDRVPSTPACRNRQRDSQRGNIAARSQHPYARPRAQCLPCFIFGPRRAAPRPRAASMSPTLQVRTPEPTGAALGPGLPSLPS